MIRRFDIEETQLRNSHRLTVLCDGREVGVVTYDKSIGSQGLRKAVKTLVKAAVGEDYDKWKMTTDQELQTIECTFRVAV